MPSGRFGELTEAGLNLVARADAATTFVGGCGTPAVYCVVVIVPAVEKFSLIAGVVIEASGVGTNTCVGLGTCSPSVKRRVYALTSLPRPDGSVQEITS